MAKLRVLSGCTSSRSLRLTKLSLADAGDFSSTYIHLVGRLSRADGCGTRPIGLAPEAREGAFWPNDGILVGEWQCAHAFSGDGIGGCSA